MAAGERPHGLDAQGPQDGPRSAASAALRPSRLAAHHGNACLALMGRAGFEPATLEKSARNDCNGVLSAETALLSSVVRQDNLVRSGVCGNPRRP
jgi:hypothetical protein